MGKNRRKTDAQQEFMTALRNAVDHLPRKRTGDARLPLLILDQKWHHLFSDVGKPDSIAALEKTLNEYLMRQGHVQQEIKDLKKLKATLMDNIMNNMDGTDGTKPRQMKKLSEDRRLIDEINERLAVYEDELQELPQKMKHANEALMLESMEYCYGKLKSNAKDIEETGAWIQSVRIELKKQVIRKQNAEMKNKEIYSYLHDIFGAQVIDLFDLHQADIERAEYAKKETKR